RIRPVDAARLDYYEVLNCVLMLGQARRHRLSGRGYPWSDPAASRRLHARIRRVTGIEVAPDEEASS
ncbi:MAG: hypothetical protein WD058_07265, partial [Dehalococcoidia bacterium]